MERADAGKPASRGEALTQFLENLWTAREALKNETTPTDIQDH
jgi:hypothetical protein